MKPLGTLSALFAATLGFASAGPLAGPNGGNAANGGTSMCASTCEQPNSKFTYIPGQSYVYKYSTASATALEQSSEKKSTIFVDADVSLQVLGPCRFALKVDAANLEEEISSRSRLPSRGSDAFAQSLKEHPLIFNYEAGVVTKLCPAVGESRSSLNIKRGILSMIQNTMAHLNESDTALDTDIMGECHTEYNVEKTRDGKLNILRTKSLSACANTADRTQVVDSIALPRRVAKSSSIVNATQECEQVVQDNFIQTVECHERHVVRPFSHQRRGASTDVRQTLRFQRIEQDANGSNPRYAEGSEQSITFDSRADDFEQQNDLLVKQARNMLRQPTADRSSDQSSDRSSDQSGDVNETNEQFSKLIHLLSQMSYSSLKALVSEFRSSERLREAVANTLTGPAVKLTAELVNENAIGTNDAKAWLLRAALATDINPAQITSMMPLLDMEDIVMEAHLAVSAIARTYLEQNPSEVTSEIRDLLSKLYSQLKSDTKDKNLIATLKAIGNVGISNGLERQLIETTRHKNVAVRLAALEAFRRLPCGQVDREPLLDVLASSSEVVEVRVAAYLNSIVCPTAKTVAVVKDVLLAEPEHSQLSSFVFSHLKNLEKRSSFSEDLSSITLNKAFESLKTQSGDLSKNYFYEMFFDPLDVGFELDAGSIYSDGLSSFMLNTTFDIFGHNVNVFDGRIRLRNDMSSFDGLLRFFGNEILYKSIDRKQMSEFESILRSVMSPKGFQFSKSMLMLDTKMVLPTGNGLSLTVAVNGTSTLALNVKAMPPQKMHGANNMAAEARAAPSVALEFGISMMVSAPKTSSGIKMIVTASSQWEVDGQVNVDRSDVRVVKSIKIGAPRDRSDMIDIRSDIYLVNAGGEVAIRSDDAKPKQVQMCSGEATHVLFGHEVCLEATYPEASSKEAAFILLRGANHFNVRLVKTDKSLKSFDVQSSFAYDANTLFELAFTVNTPGSKVDRRFTGRLYHNARKGRLGLELISPQKKAVVEGRYNVASQNKHVQLLMNLDGDTVMAFSGGLNVTHGRLTRLSPFVRVSLKNKRILLVESQIVSRDSQQFEGEVEIHSLLINENKPIKLKGEYSATGKKRLNFAIESDILTSNVASSLSVDNDGWAVSVDGHFSYKRGAKQMFTIGSNFVQDAESIGFEGTIKHNGIVLVKADGYVDRQSPDRFGVQLTLLDGRYGAKMSLETEDQHRALNAVAVWAGVKYATTVKFQVASLLAAVTANIHLPKGVEKTARLQYDFNSAIKRFAFETNLAAGSICKTQLSYVPTADLHKLTANVMFSNQKTVIVASLANEPGYEAKVDIVRNGSKFFAASLALSKDINRPLVKALVSHRDNVLLNVHTDATIDSGSVAVDLKVQAPFRLVGNASVQWLGSLKDKLKLEGEANLHGLDSQTHWGLSSSAEISIWQATKIFNVAAGVRASDGQTTSLALKNELDFSTWNVDWRFQLPDRQQQKVSSSGIFKFVPHRLSVDGAFELNVNLIGHRFTLEPLLFSAKVGRSGDSELEIRGEITRNVETAFLLALKAVNERSRKELSAELSVMGSSQRVHWTLDGHELATGWESSLDAQWRHHTISGRSNLKFDGENVHVGLNGQSSHDMLPTGKLQLRIERVGPTSKLVMAEFAFGDQVLKADVNVDQDSLTADIRTPVNKWRNIRLKALWELSPKLRLNVEFSSPIYADNVMEIVFDARKKVTGTGRLAVPALHHGDLVQAAFDYHSGKGKLDLLHRGQPAAKLSFNLKNTQTTRGLNATLSYSLNDVAHQLGVESYVTRTTSNSCDLQFHLVRNSEKFIDLSYRGAFRNEGGILVESELEARSSLFRSWQGVWISNKLVVEEQSVRTEHEVGSSPSEILYSVSASGRLNHGKHMFALDAMLDGQWRALRGSVSMEARSDKRNNISFAVRATSGDENLLSVRGDLSRRDRLVELEASWDPARTNPQASLKMRSGFEENDAFVFEIRLDRDQDADKGLEMALRVPLKLKNMEGRLKVKLPQELGRKALMASVMSQKSMINVKVESVLDDEQSYSGEATAKWNERLSLNAIVKKNKVDLVKVDLSASGALTETCKASLLFSHSNKSYKAKLSSEWNRKSAKFLLQAESSQWEQKHFVRASYSTASRNVDLKVEIMDVKITLKTNTSAGYKLEADVEHKDQPLGSMRISFNATNKRGSFVATFRGETVSTTFVAILNDGQFKLDIPSVSTDLTWKLAKQQNMTVSGQWTLKNETWRLEATANAQPAGNVKAALYCNDKPDSQLNAEWNLKEFSLDFELARPNFEQSLKLKLHKRPARVDGALHLQCPWLSTEIVDGKLQLKYSTAEVSFASELKHGSRAHSVEFAIERQGEHTVSGHIEAHCPELGDLKARLTAVLSSDGSLKAELSSDQLTKPITVNGQLAEQRVSFNLTTEKFQMKANLFGGEKFGFEGVMRLESSEDRAYEIVAFAEPYRSLRISLELPSIARTGVAVSRPTSANYELVFEWLGDKMLEAKLAGSEHTLLAGVLSAELERRNDSTKHQLVIRYNFAQKSSFTVELNGEQVATGQFDGDRKRLRGKFTVALAKRAAVAVDFEHRCERTFWLSLVKLSWNGETVGYEMLLHQHIVGSKLSVDIPPRSFLLEVNGDEFGGGEKTTVVRFGWDHSRDPQKAIRIVLSKNNFHEHTVTLSIPKLDGTKAPLHVKGTEAMHHARPSSTETTAQNAIRVSLVYSNLGKLQLRVGNLMLRGEFSPKRSQLVVRRLTTTTTTTRDFDGDGGDDDDDDINVGYRFQGRTLSARFHWSPRLNSNYQALLANSLQELDIDPDRTVSKRTFALLRAEFAEVVADVQGTMDALKHLYHNDAFGVKTMLKPVVDLRSRWMRFASRQMSQRFAEAKQLASRLGERFSAASSVFSVMRKEIREDIIDRVHQLIEHGERFNQHDIIRRPLRSLLDYVERHYEALEHAFGYAVDKFVCEFSADKAHVTNYQCGFAFGLNSQRKQHGLMIRLPVALSS